MKCRRMIVAVVAALGCGFFSGAALAVERPDALSLTLMGGGHIFEGNLLLDDGPLYSLALGYQFDKNWGTEAVFTFTDSNQTFGREDDVNVYSARLDLLYQFGPGQKLVPYLAAGLGALRYRFDGVDDDQDKPIFAYGGGLKYFLSKKLALRGDIRHILDIDAEKGDREHDIFHQLTYSAGLTYHFGGVGPEVPSWDMDEDGIANSYDRCPDTPAGVAVGSLGCPK